MPPDKNLRLPVRWAFEVVDGPAGQLCWIWQQFDSYGTLIDQSAPFVHLTECVHDAYEHGYLEPDER